MDSSTAIANLVKRLRPIRWDWGPGCLERVVAELGLVDPTTGNERDVSFRTSNPDLPPGAGEHPYSFNRSGPGVELFRVDLESIDMGEVHLYEPERYQEVFEEGHARCRAGFRKASRRIAKLLGPPVCEGERDESNVYEAYPYGWGTDAAAVWQLENARLMLLYGYEDKELPISLELLVCRPREDYD